MVRPNLVAPIAVLLPPRSGVICLYLAVMAEFENAPLPLFPYPRPKSVLPVRLRESVPNSALSFSNLSGREYALQSEACRVTDAQPTNRAGEDFSNNSHGSPATGTLSSPHSPPSPLTPKGPSQKGAEGREGTMYTGRLQYTEIGLSPSCKNTAGTLGQM